GAAGRVVAACGDDIRGRTGFARAAVLVPTGPPPSCLQGSVALGTAPGPGTRPSGVERGGGPEGKLRGRPPPPVEPRSGPWRQTGSESIAGRAQTRRKLEYDSHNRGSTTRRAGRGSKGAVAPRTSSQEGCT